LVKSLDQSSLLTIGSIIVSSVNLLAVSHLVEVSASFIMVSSWGTGGCRLTPGACPFSCGDFDGFWLSGGVEEPGKTMGDRAASYTLTGFGLKKPINVFWPAAEPPEDVDTADLGRFVDVVCRG
jgi:hypothetical protein